MPTLDSFDEFLCQKCSDNYNFLNRLPSFSDESKNLSGECSLPENDIRKGKSGDLFFKKNWRERQCHCDSCLKNYELLKISYLLDNESIYSPEEDDDRNLSLYEAGSRALERMDRITALEGLYAINKLKDELKDYLKPFAESGISVTKKVKF